MLLPLHTGRHPNIAGPMSAVSIHQQTERIVEWRIIDLVVCELLPSFRALLGGERHHGVFRVLPRRILQQEFVVDEVTGEAGNRNASLGTVQAIGGCAVSEATSPATTTAVPTTTNCHFRILNPRATRRRLLHRAPRSCRRRRTPERFHSQHSTRPAACQYNRPTPRGAVLLLLRRPTSPAGAAGPGT